MQTPFILKDILKFENSYKSLKLKPSYKIYLQFINSFEAGHYDGKFEPPSIDKISLTKSKKRRKRTKKNGGMKFKKGSEKKNRGKRGSFFQIPLKTLKQPKAETEEERFRRKLDECPCLKMVLTKIGEERKM